MERALLSLPERKLTNAGVKEVLDDFQCQVRPPFSCQMISPPRLVQESGELSLGASLGEVAAAFSAGTAEAIAARLADAATPFSLATLAKLRSAVPLTSLRGPWEWKGGGWCSRRRW